jgi:hypothetical protein
VVVAGIVRKLMSDAVLVITDTKNLCFCECAVLFQNLMQRPADELAPAVTAFSQRTFPVQTSGAGKELDTIRMIFDQLT